MRTGLEPIKKGIAPPMFSAFVAAVCFHFFLNLKADEVVYGVKKAKVCVAAWFILHGFYSNGIFGKMLASPAKKAPATPIKVKKEK